MDNYTYYAQRKSVKNREPQTPNNRYGTRSEMERQFHLYCASAAINEAGNDKDEVEWGTVEEGKLDRKYWEWPAKQPEPEPEPEPTPEPEEPEDESGT